MKTLAVSLRIYDNSQEDDQVLENLIEDFNNYELNSGIYKGAYFVKINSQGNYKVMLLSEKNNPFPPLLYEMIAERE